MVLVGIIILLAVATPFLHMRLGLPDAGSQPTNQTTRRAYDLDFRRLRSWAPMDRSSWWCTPQAESHQGRSRPSQTSTRQQKSHLPADVASIGPPIPNPASDVFLVEVTPKTGPNDPATTHLINSIRPAVAKGQKEYGLETFVTGQTALNVDISAKLSSALPAYLAIIILLCVILLVVVFRSILVPLAAVIGYVVSVLAALGAVTFVFQQGHLDGLFGIARPGPVLSFLPIILLGIFFGLAMDYEVFLESRMREESLRKDPTTAVIDGYTGSAKVVASAAIIMIAVFASFIFSADPTTKSLGFALALGVLIDAFVIRMTVIPATMYIFGGAAWWLPSLAGALSSGPRY